MSEKNTIQRTYEIRGAEVHILARDIKNVTAELTPKPQ